MSPDQARREFLRFLVASPLIALPAGLSAYPERAVPASLRDVLNISQLDVAAQNSLSREAYHFIVGASDDGITKRANIEAFQRLRIRPRRLIDVSTIDLTAEIFGKIYPSPVVLAPVGNQQMLFKDGELATARAAEQSGNLMICSMLTNFSIGQIASVGAPNWLQLYPSPNRKFMRKLMDDASQAGCDAIVLTIDGPTRGNHEAEQWFRRHPTVDDAGAKRTRLGNFENFTGSRAIGDPALTWSDLQWFRHNTQLKIVLKGIVTAEDAELCRKYGVDGVVVSNHGGRQEGSGRGTMDVLPEVLDVLLDRMPVLIDGGIRRGSDIFKALALGATAVCIGRPYLWGLGAYGQAGVTKCLSLLQAELTRSMQYAGTPTLDDIRADRVWTGAA